MTDGRRPAADSVPFPILSRTLKHALARGLLWGAGIGLLIAVPVGWVFGDIILWTFLGPAIGASFTVNAFLTHAVLADTSAHAHRCSACAYDLTGLTTTTCPECGARIEPEPERHDPTSAH